MGIQPNGNEQKEEGKMPGEGNGRHYFLLWHFIQVLAVMDSQRPRMPKREGKLENM